MHACVLAREGVGGCVGECGVWVGAHLGTFVTK